MTRQDLNAPPPIRRLDPQDPTPAQTAPEHGATFVAAKRSIAAPQFSIRRMEVDKMSIHYGAKEAVKSVSLPIRQGEVLGLIGPSGCGKTTLLRSLNRLTELNVIRQVRNVASDVFVREAWDRGQSLMVHGWVYSLSSGLVTDLDVTVSGPADLDD